MKWRKRVEELLLKRAASDFMDGKMKQDYSSRNLAEKAMRHMLCQFEKDQEEDEAKGRGEKE